MKRQEYHSLVVCTHWRYEECVYVYTLYNTFIPSSRARLSKLKLQAAILYGVHPRLLLLANKCKFIVIFAAERFYVYISARAFSITFHRCGIHTILSQGEVRKMKFAPSLPPQRQYELRIMCAARGKCVIYMQSVYLRACSLHITERAVKNYILCAFIT